MVFAVSQALPGEPRLLAAGGEGGDPQVLLHPLPSLLFSNGHVAFVQRSPFQPGRPAPFAIHATFQRYNLEGKRARFRYGWWLLRCC